MAYIPSERIRQIEAKARQRYMAVQHSRKPENMTRAFFELHQNADLQERQALTYAYALVNEPIAINPEDRIHGMFYCKGAGDPFCGYEHKSNWGKYNAQFSARRRIEAELPELLDYFDIGPDGKSRSFIINGEGTPGHIAWRWDWVLRDGLEAIIQRHREAAQRPDADAQSRGYYQGVAICLEAILEWNRRHVEAINALVKSGNCDTKQQQSLLACAEAMRNVPARPARNFHEALQAYHFMWICAFFDGTYGGNSPGRFDTLLWPYLRREYEQDAISQFEATELVAETFIKCDEMIHDGDGGVLTIVTGGLTQDMQDAVNPLSYMVIDAIEALDITHPAVYNRISKKNPEAYRRRCYQYMLRGHNRAQFLNEEAILRALTRDGYMSEADAAMYICGGCMELNPQGLTSDLFWSFRYNICKTLELCITGGVDLVDGSQRLSQRPTLSEHRDFESFYNYFESEVEKILTLKFKALDIASVEMGRLRPQFVISSMIEGCFEKGRNQMRAARYADYGGSVIGMPNVANSLMAIKRAVYDEKFVSAEGLLAALKANFAEQEVLRKRLQQQPKYGEQNPEADGMMNRILRSVSRVVDSYRTINGGRCKQVHLTFFFAPAFGAALGATPEGNLAGTAVAHGLTPFRPAAELTSAIQSYLSLENELVSGGASTMWDMDADCINETLLASIYRVFEDGGGQIFQGNMTDVKELEKAYEKPEDYPGLIVRVGGYSARFQNLAPEVRLEIIKRRRWKN